MNNVSLAKGIYWVGVIDWDLRNFHGYLTQRGSTYNSYLIVDEKITLIDTVKGNFANEMIRKISNIIDPSKIDYVVANHVEMDHSGSLPNIMELAKNATIVTSAQGAKGLERHFKQNWNYKTVTTGETLSLGENSLQFGLTPMVHWPDNMVTYCPEHKILFSNDSFGQHLASSERFDDDYDRDIVFHELKKYYANIVLPYGVQVKKELELASTMDIEIIAPSHGIIFRKYVNEIIEKYTQWCENNTSKKALIIYDTMWHSTEKIAKIMEEAFDEQGYSTRVMNLQYIHVSDVMTEVLDAEYLCIGSPTLNSGMLPNVAAFLAYAQGLAPKNRKAIAFGSYGWGGQSIPQIEKFIKENMRLDVKKSIKVQYIPDEKELEDIKQQIIEIIKEN